MSEPGPEEPQARTRKRAISISSILLGLVLLVSPAVRADALVATRTADTLFVHRVSSDRLEKLLEEKGKGAYAYAWVDATLWVLRKDKTAVTLGKVVDGRAEAGKPITGLETVTPEDAPGGLDVSPGLTATRSGLVFVTSCIGREPVPGTPSVRRCKLAYYRADDGSLARAAKPPRDIAFQWDRTRPARMRPLKRPPKRYRVTIVKTKLPAGTYTGFRCTGPNGARAWPTAADTDLVEPAFAPKVNKATWLATTPPIVHIEANGTSPVGAKLHQEWFLVDCATQVSSVHPLRDGLWMTGDEVRRPNGTVIGKLPGGEVVVSP